MIYKYGINGEIETETSETDKKLIIFKLSGAYSKN